MNHEVPNEIARKISLKILFLNYWVSVTVTQFTVKQSMNES